MEAFFDDPVFSNGALSPNGKYLAMVLTDKLHAVVVTDLETNITLPILPLTKKGEAIKGLTVDWLDWKGDDRLIVGMTIFDIKREGGRSDGEILGLSYGRFIMAVDRDGKNPVQLLKGGFWNSERGIYASLLDRLRKDPDHILAVAPNASREPAIWKTDIHTGAAELVEVGDDSVDAWRTDTNGAVVARYRHLYSGSVIEGRAPGQKDWTTIVRLRPKDFKGLDDFEFLGPTDKPAQLYVAVKPKDKTEGDNRILRVYDLTTKTLSAPVWPALKYDLDDIVYDGDTSNLSGVCYTVDVYTCDFKDPAVTKNFRAISTYFHDERNIVPVSVTNDARWWLFSVSGPDEPASYYLFDWKTKEIQRVAEQYKRLTTDLLAPMQRWTYAARDGVNIPAYLTRPRNAPAGPLPLIVMPHGGPEARDSFSFDTWDQFLATRGYLVFQPNFRGSGGYGIAYGAAGYGQWNGVMADDITDGVRELIATGQVDPNRICIFGASYGGYAALFAGATHPELYKCVVSRAGDADLMASLKYERSYAGKDSPRYQYWLKSMGDPDKQADQLKQASPITYAASYKPPVLLIHGLEDTVVAPDQSQQMQRALKKAGKDVQLITFKTEGHRDWDDDHEQAALAAIANFIEAHIAPAPPQIPAATTNAKPPPASGVGH